jgi:DNA-binding MarR family transcriptional regulator
MMVDMKTPHGSYLCHCLAARRHARLLTRFYDHHLAAANLTISQFSILAVVEERPMILIAELAESMAMERTTLMRAIKPLQNDGFLLSEAQGPRSTIRLSLSEQGKAKIREAEVFWKAAQLERERQVGAEKASAIRDALLEQARHT